MGGSVFFDAKVRGVQIRDRIPSGIEDADLNRHEGGPGADRGCVLLSQ